MKAPPPRLNFKTEHVKVGYLISLYVMWNGSGLDISDDITPETITGMVLAYHKEDEDWLVGWKRGDKYPYHNILLDRYHNTRASSMMCKCEHVPRMTDYWHGLWMPSNHRVVKVESTIAGCALAGMVCDRCKTHNPYVEPDPYGRKYVCKSCTSWDGTFFVPPSPETQPSLDPC